MSSDDPPTNSARAANARFATTHWSLVAAAGRPISPESHRALAELCESYWYPIYAYVRRRGYRAEDAQDLTQSFFATLLEKEYLAAADPARGRFRSFLLATCNHFLAHQRDRARAQKRGGGRQALSLDLAQGESRYRLEPADKLTPEKIFERRWALMLLERVLAGLREEYAAAGKHALFERLKEYLTAQANAPTYRQAAAALGMTEGAVKVAAHRLRRRYRQLVVDEIARTVASPNDIDDELRQLFAAVQSPSA